MQMETYLSVYPPVKLGKHTILGAINRLPVGVAENQLMLVQEHGFKEGCERCIGRKEQVAFVPKIFYVAKTSSDVEILYQFTSCRIKFSGWSSQCWPRPYIYAPQDIGRPAQLIRSLSVQFRLESYCDHNTISPNVALEFMEHENPLHKIGLEHKRISLVVVILQEEPYFNRF